MYCLISRITQANKCESDRASGARMRYTRTEGHFTALTHKSGDEPGIMRERRRRTEKNLSLVNSVECPRGRLRFVTCQIKTLGKLMLFVLDSNFLGVSSHWFSLFTYS